MGGGRPQSTDFYKGQKCLKSWKSLLLPPDGSLYTTQSPFSAKQHFLNRRYRCVDRPCLSVRAMSKWFKLPNVLSVCPRPPVLPLSSHQSKKHANKVRLFYMLHPEDGGPPSKRLRPDNPVSFLQLKRIYGLVVKLAGRGPYVTHNISTTGT